MYSIDSTYGIARAQGSKWQAHDISSLTGAQLYTLFRRLYIKLTTSLLSAPQVIDIADYAAVLAYDSRDIDVIFDTWTDTTPLITKVLPAYKSTRAVFTDATRANYNIQRSIPGAHYTSSQDNILRTEMQLSRNGTDMTLVRDYCLVTSNGYFYRVDANREMAFVAEAGKSLLKTRANHVGILSFENIGKIHTYPVVAADVVPHTSGAGLYEGASVKLPAVDLAGKSLLMVLGGYLHFASDGVFKRIADDRALVRPGAVDLLQRYQESVDKVDWSTIVGANPNPKVLNVATLRSDAGILALLTHPQTFWVVIDTPSIAKARLPLRALPLPGQFISAREPKELLVAGSGYVLEYWKVEQDKEWAVNCSGVRPGRAISGTIGREGWVANVAMVNTAYEVYANIQASFLDIVADEVQG